MNKSRNKIGNRIGKCLRWKVICLSVFLIFYVKILPQAQDFEKVDSLVKALDGEPLQSQYATFLELTFQFVDVDNKVALEWINKAYRSAMDLNDTIKIVHAGRIKGQLLRRIDNLDEAIKIFNKLLPIAKRHKIENDYEVILNSLAIAYSDRANFDKALEYHFQALLIRDAEGDKSAMSITLGNIGVVYYKLNDFEKAIHFYNRSLQLKEESGDDYGVDFTLINIGHCYNALRLHDKARDYIKRGLKKCGDNGLMNTRIDGEYGLGISYFSLEEYNEAKEHFSKSYSLSKESDNKRFQAENLILLGRIAMKEKDYRKADELLLTAENLAALSGYNRLLIDSYKHLSSLYKEEQDFQRASFYQDKYIQLKDSIYSEGLIKNLSDVQTKFEERENIKTIASHEEELSQQRQLIIAVVIIAVLAGLLVFMLIRSNSAKKKANERLDQEVQAATKDLEVANRLLGKVNQELDHFIYKTSHDIRGPLASLKGLCNVAITDVKDPLAIDYLNKLEFTATRLDTLLSRLQKINQINHANLKFEAINFIDLVNDLEHLEKRKGVPNNFTIKKDIQRDIEFTSDRELIYLVLENLMDNAIKFYNNTGLVDPFVLIKINSTANELIISVIDNGIGIGQVDPEELFQMFVRASERSVSGGIGLYLSRRATEKLGGEIHMRTTPEGYTEFFIIFPLESGVGT